MKNSYTFLVIAAILLAMNFAVPAAAMDMMHGPGMMHHHGMGMMGGSRARHMYVMHNGLDPKYANLTNPLPATSANISAGKTLFEQNCARCHGPQGLGNGEAGQNLVPRPANLAHVVRMRIASDGYLYWAISEGGVPFHTAMPAWKEALKDSDIWAVILYLHTLSGY